MFIQQELTTSRSAKMAYLVENLPNVCIKSILLDNVQDSDALYKVVVDISVKALDTSNRWIDDDFMVKHLNVIAVMSSNGAFNKKVTSGQIKITERTIKEHLSTDPDKSIVLKQIPVRVKKTTIEKNNSAIFSFEFTQNHVTDDLRVFAMTSVNMSELCIQYGGDPMSESLSAYHGSITSEAIIKEGLKVSTATVFSLGNSPYLGPVHAHGGGYMVGSQHTNTPHPRLSTRQVPNLKLKDNRINSYQTINSISSKIKDRPIVSEVYTTFGSNNSLKGVFSINIEQLMLSKTKYGKSFYNLTDDQYNNILSSFYIKSMKLYRKVVRTGKKSKKINKVISRTMIAQTKDQPSENKLIAVVRMDEKSVSHGKESVINVPIETAPQYSLNDYMHISTLKEENLYNRNRIRTFSFVDKHIAINDHIEYSYEIKIEFIDATAVVVQDGINKINNSIDKLERYIYLSGLQKNYDFDLKKMKKTYMTSQGDQYLPLSSAPWIEAPATYASHLSFVNNLSSFEIESTARKYSNFLIPESFDLSSAKLFLKEYKEFANVFRKKFNLPPGHLSGRTSARSQNIFQNKNTSDILLQHSFPKVIRTKEVDLGYEILDFEEGLELATISKQTFETMISNDNDKFFEGQISLSKEEISSLSKEEYMSYKNFRRYRPSYLSPRMLKKGRNTIKVDMKIMANIDHKALSNLSKTKVPFFAKKFPLQTLSIDAINKTEEVDVDFVKAEKYFGVDSNFVTTDGIESEDNQESTYRMTPAFFNQNLLSNSLITRSNFDILEGDVSIPPDLPNQIKSIIGSRSRSAKNTFLDSDVDALKLPQTSDSVEMMFLTLQRVMYCSGFDAQPAPGESSGTNPEDNESSLRKIKKPIWKILDQTALDSLSGDVLCKTEYYEPSGMKMSIAEANKFNVYNNLFIISFPITPRTIITDMSINQMLQSQYSNVMSPDDIEYSTTNIVLQPTTISGDSGSNFAPAPGTGGNTMGTGGSSMGTTGGGYGY